MLLRKIAGSKKSNGTGAAGKGPVKFFLCSGKIKEQWVVGVQRVAGAL
jgi:hypothetical protein